MSELRDVATTRNGAERRISTLERRGTSARTQLERDVRKARKRLEGIASSAKDRVTAIAEQHRSTSPGAPTESGARERFAGLIPRRRMQYLSSLNRRRAFGHGGGA